MEFWTTKRGDGKKAPKAEGDTPPTKETREDARHAQPGTKEEKAKRIS